MLILALFFWKPRFCFLCNKAKKKTAEFNGKQPQQRFERDKAEITLIRYKRAEILFSLQKR